MSRRSLWPGPRPTGVPGFRTPRAIPINRQLFIKGIGVTKLTPIPLPPGMPGGGKFVAELVMMKSNDAVVKTQTELTEGMALADIVREIHDGFQWLQTFLNCACTPAEPCPVHRPAVDEKKLIEPPSKIVLTDR